MKFYSNVFLRNGTFYVREFVNGERQHWTKKGVPYLFLPNPKGEYRTHTGLPVSKETFSSIGKAREFLDGAKDVENFKVFGMERWIFPFINDEWPGEIQYDFSKLKIAYLDIEVASDDGMPSVALADKPVTAISMKIGDRILSFGCGDWTPQEELVAYRKCDDEADLLTQFLYVWKREMPDIVTGWNIRGFDIPYLVNRMGEELSKQLSPWGMLRKDIVTFFKKKFEVSEPAGVTVLDYMHLYRKFNLAPRESYSLNHIAHVELGTTKLDYSEYDSLSQLYRSNFAKFMMYNVIDVDLIDQLEEKLRLVELAATIAYEAKVNLDDVIASTRPWDARIHNFLMAQKIVVPTIMPRYDDAPEGEPEDEEVEGGWVKEPIPGLYEYVAGFDVTSEYPNLIITYGISPDTYSGKYPTGRTVDDILKDGHPLLDALKHNDMAMCANMTMYSKKKPGFLPTLMAQLFAKRKIYKKKKKEDQKYAVYDDAAKVGLNSGFGVLLNPYFRWYNADNGEAITKTGQLTVRTAGKTVNDYMNKILKTEDVDYWIASDTDSIFINFGPLMNYLIPIDEPVTEEQKYNFIDHLCRTKILPLLAKAFEDLAKSMNARDNTVVINRETICDKAIWCGAKNYVLRVVDEEGKRLEKPSVTIKGLKGFKPSNPEIARGAMRSVVDYVLDGDLSGLRDYVDEFKDRFNAMAMEDIAIPRSISGLAKYAGEGDELYKPKIPIQVRGALIYNRMLRHKLIKGMPPIYDGDKCKYCYLQEPNPTGEEVITIINSLPKKFNLEKYIDYKTMFDKTFLSHVDILLNAIGWKLEDYATLEGLFE